MCSLRNRGRSRKQDHGIARNFDTATNGIRHFGETRPIDAPHPLDSLRRTTFLCPLLFILFTTTSFTTGEKFAPRSRPPGRPSRNGCEHKPSPANNRRPVLVVVAREDGQSRPTATATLRQSRHHRRVPHRQSPRSRRPARERGSLGAVGRHVDVVRRRGLKAEVWVRMKRCLFRWLINH